MKLLAAARGLLSARPLLSAAVAAAPPHGRTSAVTVRVSLAVPTSAPGARPAQPPPPLRQTTGDARWLLLVADDQGRLQHVRRFAAAQLAQAQSGQRALTLPLTLTLTPTLTRTRTRTLPLPLSLTLTLTLITLALTKRRAASWPSRCRCRLAMPPPICCTPSTAPR